MKINKKVIEELAGYLKEFKLSEISYSDGTTKVKVSRSVNNLGIISTETNKVVARRSEKLNIECIQGVGNKRKSLEGYCIKNGFDLKKVLFIGNDINDLEVMELVGYPLCPADAHESVKIISRFIFSKKGGDGVVRELLDLIKEMEGK